MKKTGKKGASLRGTVYLIVGVVISYLVWVSHGDIAGEAFIFLWLTMLMVLRAVFKLTKAVGSLLIMLGTIGLKTTIDKGLLKDLQQQIKKEAGG